MQLTLGLPSSWKGTKTVDESKQLIDYGVMLKWRDMRTLRRSFTEADEQEVVRHFARRLVVAPLFRRDRAPGAAKA